MGGPAYVGGKPLQSTNNFLKAPIHVPCVVVDSNGVPQEQPVEWQTCEHLFQALKFDSLAGGKETREHCRQIQQAESALDAWALGQSRQHPIRDDWEDVKAFAMYGAVKAKYEQYPVQAAQLAATGTDPILAAPSTSNWQRMNSMVLERVRFELGASNKTPVADYQEWCQETDLPHGCKPLTVYLSSKE